MLKLRIISAVVLGAILAAALAWLPPSGWALFTLLFIAIAAWEWSGFARMSPPARFLYAGTVTLIAAGVLGWTDATNEEIRTGRLLIVYGVAAVFWILCAWGWVRRNPQRPPRWLVASLGVFALAPFYVAVVDLRALGVHWLLVIMGLVWTADIAAYFVGRRFGRRKLAPAVSPGKTVEGVIGALVCVALYALLASAWLQGISTATLLTVTAAIGLAVISVVGDLFESSLKRQAGLKDSGNVLPGHGGILDRIDALLPVLPIAALLLVR